MYLARKEMQKLAQEQAAKASQADQKRIEEEEENEEGTSTEEEGGDLFPISPDTSKKAKTPFSGQGKFLTMLTQVITCTNTDICTKS